MNSTKSSVKSNFLYHFIFGAKMKRVDTFDREAIMIGGEGEGEGQVNNNSDKASPKANRVVTTGSNDYDNFSDIENNVLHLFSSKTPTSWAVMNEKGGLLCASEMRKGVEKTDADVDTRGLLQFGSAGSGSGRNYLILFILSSITSLGGYLIHKYGKNMRGYCPAFFMPLTQR